MVSADSVTNPYLCVLTTLLITTSAIGALDRWLPKKYLRMLKYGEFIPFFINLFTVVGILFVAGFICGMKDLIVSALILSITYAFLETEKPGDEFTTFYRIRHLLENPQYEKEIFKMIIRKYIDSPNSIMDEYYDYIVSLIRRLNVHKYIYSKVHIKVNVADVVEYNKRDYLKIIYVENIDIKYNSKNHRNLLNLLEENIIKKYGNSLSPSVKEKIYKLLLKLREYGETNFIYAIIYVNGSSELARIFEELEHVAYIDAFWVPDLSLVKKYIKEVEIIISNSNREFRINEKILHKIEIENDAYILLAMVDAKEINEDELVNISIKIPMFGRVFLSFDIPVPVKTLFLEVHIDKELCNNYEFWLSYFVDAKQSPNTRSLLYELNNNLNSQCNSGLLQWEDWVYPSTYFTLIRVPKRSY